MTEDRIYIDEKRGNEPFRFDASVAAVFPDMLRRSIPGYAASLEAIGSLLPPTTRSYLPAGTLKADGEMAVAGATTIAPYLAPGLGQGTSAG